MHVAIFASVVVGRAAGRPPGPLVAAAARRPRRPERARAALRCSRTAAATRSTPSRTSSVCSPDGGGRMHHGGVTDPAPEATLTGRLLVATPALGDSNFERSVVLVLDHDEDGALGVVINRPTPVDVAEVLPVWQPFATEPGVLFQGGPVALDSALGLALVPGRGRGRAARLAPGRRTARPGRPRRAARGARRRGHPAADLRRLRRLGRRPAGGRARRGRLVRRRGALRRRRRRRRRRRSARRPRTSGAQVLRRQGGDLAMVSTYLDDPSLN